MKKYSQISKIILSSMLIIFALLAIQQLTINPLRLGQNLSIENLNENRITTNERYIKHKYLLENANSYDAVLIGPSAASTILVENQDNKKWFSYTSAYMSLFETKRLLQDLQKTNITTFIITLSDENLKTDEVGDYYTVCSQRYGIEYFPTPQSTKEKLYFYTKNFFSLPIANLIKNQIEQLHQEPQKALKDLSTEDITYILPISSQEVLAERFSEITEIKNFAKQNNLNITFIYLPEYSKVYNLHKDYNNQTKNKLSDIISFYDFSGDNEINRNPNNYYDLIHFNEKVGNLVLDRLFSQNKNNPPKIKDFGNYYTK